MGLSTNLVMNVSTHKVVQLPYILMTQLRSWQGALCEVVVFFNQCTCLPFVFQSPARLGSDGMVAVVPGHSLSLRFGKGFDKRASKLERGVSASGVGPSIGIEVRLAIPLTFNSQDLVII